ncbi:MAG: SRPBCC family protein [Planctomycetota bacterium]
MVSMTLRKQVDAPPERVFDVASDFANAGRNIRAITSLEVLTAGPIGVGTRFRETRTMFGRPATEEMVIIGFERPRSYTVGCENHGCTYRTEFRFEPTAGGTEIAMTFEAVPRTLAAKVMGFLLRPLLRKCIKETEKDLDDLKAVAEGRPTQAP